MWLIDNLKKHYPYITFPPIDSLKGEKFAKEKYKLEMFLKFIVN